MQRVSILVIEDDEDILELLVYNLDKAGFDVATARSGDDGLSLAKQCRPSLVLLDLMLPGIPGMEVCRRLKRQPETRRMPVIMLTARSEEADIVSGLELGADDYVTKPFRMRELLARIGAVLRRAEAEEKEPVERVVHGPIVIDPDRHEVRIGGDAVELTLAEYRLLHALATSPGQVHPRERLLASITDGGYHISSRNVDVHIAAIRRKLGDAGKLIATVRGVGYKLRGPDD